VKESDATGCYHLLYHLPRPTRLRVGALGCFALPAGWYVYTGSAFGPGGLAARVARHRACARHLTSPGDPPRAPHWHVDYLAAVAALKEVVLLPERERRECAHARYLQTLPGASVPVPRFGASDCRCPAHLVRFAQRPPRSSLRTTDGC